MERFTQRARRVLSLAHEEAERMHHGYIGTEHLLLGLIREEGGVAGRVLRELGLDLGRVKEMVERLTGIGRHIGGRIELAPGTEQVLQIAIEEARRMEHHYPQKGKPSLGGHSSRTKVLFYSLLPRLLSFSRVCCGHNTLWL